MWTDKKKFILVDANHVPLFLTCKIYTLQSIQWFDVESTIHLFRLFKFQKKPTNVPLIFESDNSQQFSTKKISIEWVLFYKMIVVYCALIRWLNLYLGFSLLYSFYESTQWNNDFYICTAIIVLVSFIWSIESKLFIIFTCSLSNWIALLSYSKCWYRSSSIIFIHLDAYGSLLYNPISTNQEHANRTVDIVFPNYHCPSCILPKQLLEYQ